MAKAQQGDSNTYAQLLGAITVPLRAFLRARLFNGSVVEDVLQDTLLAIHAARHTYRPDQPFANWMYGIARHKMIDHLRREGRKTSHEMESTPLAEMVAAPGNDPEAALISRQLKKVIDTLPAKQKQIVVLTKLEGFSMAEAGRKLGMSEGATKIAAHRAYKTLQERLVTGGYV